MTALSILVSNEIARDSLFIAKQMHISRAQFIRLAIENEIKSYKLKIEQEKMLVGFQALKNNFVLRSVRSMRLEGLFDIYQC